MDNLTHSLVGLTVAKAGLERLSPYSTAVCILSANSPDLDFVSLFFGDRWTLLQHHRGITHSIIGTLFLGLLVPSIVFGLERMISRVRKRPPTIRYGGLLIASMVSAATHPLMDWTNNYGIRPLLPWNGKWFYGDLLFIVDPYIWLVLGGTAFLLTSNRPAKIVGWSALGIVVSALVIMASVPRVAGGAGLGVARTIWIIGLVILVLMRAFGLQKLLGKSTALATLALVILYWGALAFAHHAAYRNAVLLANGASSQRGEQFIRVAAMPTIANPFRWQCVAETDRAMYRFFVGTGSEESLPDTLKSVADGRPPSASAIERYEKPSGQSAQLVSLAERDRRAQVLLGFARFPIERVESGSCIGQTLVQFADLRYTEPGARRGTFSLDVPVECPTR
jgi:inner membrane protein